MLYSTEHKVSPNYPTCLDYIRQHNRDTIVVDLMDEYNRFFPRSIGEDEELGRVHVIHTLGNKVLVMTYTGSILFSYPLEGEFQPPLFKPRALCIRNNLIFISDLRNKMIFIFTLEGNSVSHFPCPDNSPSTPIKRPKGIAVDKDNTIYVSMLDSLQILNSTLPVHQIFGAGKIGKPKDVQLFNEFILVLSWDNVTSVFFLTTDGLVVRQCVIRRHVQTYGYTGRPWYFDLDHYGNMLLIFFRESRSMLELYSQDGNLIASQKLSKLDRPRGLKLLKDKNLIAISAYGENSLYIM
ncbi:hypothetical protein LOD99_13553 [Oopsacas minuta]|uniref:Uncharacterized protein n=1 Tax=Oopsacas minuta TaxID=111878 RepID=A0AAV7KI89_9METZ|nr:hypothetical protein LOD99_13553 [Oopsacas minuta]